MHIHSKHELRNANDIHRERLTIGDRIGLFITNRVGTMWAALIFTFIALISLPAAIHTHDLIVIISWIAQTFLQLVLLPIIIVGQNVQAKHAEVKTETDHLTLLAIREINEKQTVILEELRLVKQQAQP